MAHQLLSSASKLERLILNSVQKGRLDRHQVSINLNIALNLNCCDITSSKRPLNPSD